jgi:transposase InsO family protein
LGVLFAGKISYPRDLKRILETSSKRVRLRIKKIRSDNGTEFKNSQIEGFLEEEGIKHEFSSPYMPQQNGVVERKNRTLLDMARTIVGTMLRRRRSCRKKRLSAEVVCMRWPKVPLHEASVLQTDLKIE